MIYMIVGKGGHGEITMVVTLLPPDIHFPLPPRRFLEVLRQELTLLVEIVGCAL